jgi:hypothetical protein
VIKMVLRRLAQTQIAAQGRVVAHVPDLLIQVVVVEREAPQERDAYRVGRSP